MKPDQFGLIKQISHNVTFHAQQLKEFFYDHPRIKVSGRSNSCKQSLRGTGSANGKSRVLDYGLKTVPTIA